MLLPIFPLLFYPIGSLCFSMREGHWAKSIVEYASIITNLIPHLCKLRDYAINVSVFDCILGMATVSGLIIGVVMAFIFVPHIYQRAIGHQIDKIVNTKSYFLLFGFCVLVVWFLWIDGPAKPETLPRMMWGVAKSNIGIETYGLMYYFVSMMMPICISTLVVITPTYLTFLKNRKF